jgi:hypothetical protein
MCHQTEKSNIDGGRNSICRREGVAIYEEGLSGTQIYEIEDAVIK